MYTDHNVCTQIAMCDVYTDHNVCTQTAMCDVYTDHNVCTQTAMCDVYTDRNVRRDTDHNVWCVHEPQFFTKGELKRNRTEVLFFGSFLSYNP